jgi:hypothetical protein
VFNLLILQKGKNWILSHLPFTQRSKKTGNSSGRQQRPKSPRRKAVTVAKKTPGVSAMQTNADENGTRTRATFVTRKYVKITLTWRHNQLGHLTYEFDEAF